MTFYALLFCPFGKADIGQLHTWSWPMMDLDWIVQMAAGSHEEGTTLQFKLLDFAVDQLGIDL